MTCPKCSKKLRVYATQEFDQTVVRYRKCSACAWKGKSIEELMEGGE